MIDENISTQFVQLVLKGINREYPHSGKVWLNSEADVKSPHVLNPAFYGCLDWHSAVHGHWLLVRLARCLPEASFQVSARNALNRNLTLANIQGEVAYLKQHPTFECPYGWAWLLQLTAELREWADPQARAWLSAIEPLESIVAMAFKGWLQKLGQPDRTGTHLNTAFALSLALDWSRISDDESLTTLIYEQARRFYLQDYCYPIALEPLGYDFISPSLAEADLLRRFLNPLSFTTWLTRFLPPGEQDLWQPTRVRDVDDYRQAHFRGLNLSRAWMLEGIFSGLPSNDSCSAKLQFAAQQHRNAGLLDVTNEHYSSSHWVGTFAVYLLTERGLKR